MPDTYDSDYKALSLLSKALIFGILIFSGVAIAVHFIDGPFISDKTFSNTVFAVLLFTSVIVITVARNIYNKKEINLRQGSASVTEKLVLFRALTIRHLAFCEMPALIGIVCFMGFGNSWFFIPVIMSLMEMLRKLPTQERVRYIINSSTF